VIQLPVLPQTPERLVPCTECGRCCTYVAVGINAPTTPRFATDVLWYLYHEGVSVYRDADGEWAMLFEARCRNLQNDLLCAIYEKRPHICRAFDNTGCEVNAPGGVVTFHEPTAFLAYLQAKRPRVYRAVARKYLPPALNGATEGTETTALPMPGKRGGKARRRRRE
jgi:Fe-S-cluster containining protein